MKVKRKLKALIAMLICMVTVLGSTMVTQAYTAHTQQEALQWLNSQVGTGIDANGMFGCQCVDLIKAYYQYLGVPAVSGNGIDYTWNAKPDGWERIQGAVPQLGDILVYTGGSQDEEGNYLGHVAICGESPTITYHQNFNGPYVERVTGIRYDGFTADYWGVIRPDFNSTPVTVSLTWGNEDCQWDTTNAYMYAEADTNVSGSFTEAGITVWNEAGGVVASKSENPGITGTHLNVWYNITNDTGVVLEQGTNYTYQFYTVFNGTRYEGAVHSFRTNGPSVNSWTQELSISDWTYGQEASVPSASAKYGDVVYTYSTEENGEYTAEVPQSAGTYYVKASVAEAPDQYTGLEAIKKFHIYKAVPSYTVPENITATYGQTLADVTLDGRFVWMDNTQTVGDVGEKSFLATYVPEDSINYSFVNNIEIPVIVQPKDLSDMDLSGIDKDTDLNSYELKDGDTVLIKDTDYTITSVKDGDNVTVTVEFMGNYTGTAQTTYSLKDDSQIQTDNKNDNTDSSKNTDNKNTDDTQTEKDSDETKVPQTGDTSPIAVWAVMIALSGLAAGMVFKKRITDR